MRYSKFTYKLFISLSITVFTFLTASADTDISSDITENTTWDLAGSPYILTGYIDVTSPDDPVLIVEAGVEVRFNSNASLRIGNNTYSENMGGLMVQGTEADPVLFTSNAATPAPGDWGYIYFMNYASDADCSLEWAVFEYGGSVQGLVYVNHAAPEFDNCTFRYSNTRGINCTSTTSAPGVNNCSFIDCTDYPIGIYADQLYRLGSGNSFSGNGTQAIHVTGNRLYYSQTWQPQAVPFRFVSSVEVRANAGETSVLTIDPGTILEFEEGMQFNVGNSTYNEQLGGLMAENVTFRGVTATPGAWLGLFIQRYNVPDSTILTGCTIRDGGAASSLGNVRIRLNSEATLTGCTFSNGAAFGVYQDDPATAHVSDCFFTDNVGTISLMANDLLYLGSGNSYSGNSDDRIEVRGDTIERDAVWVTQTTPLHIIGSVDISKQSEFITLTVQYGAELEFAAGTRFRIGNTTYNERHGALQAIGVTFRGDLTVPGHWYGLTFERYGEPSTLSSCTVSDAGYSFNRSIYVNLVDPVITGCQIMDGTGDGIYLTNGSRPALSGNQISGHTDYPISLFANDAGALLPGNDFTGNGIDLVEVRHGIITESAVWENPGIPYAPTGTCQIAGSANLPHLEIRPGCEIQLASDTYFQVGSTTYSYNMGSLYAEEVLFTHQAEGEYHRGVYFARYATDELCQLKNCIVEYGGSAGQANVLVNYAEPTLDGVVLRLSSGLGLRVNDYSVPTDVRNCVFENNGSYPVSIYADYLESMGSGNSYTGNSPDRINVYSDVVTQSQTWNNQGVPLEITGNLDIAHASQPNLTISSGTRLLFADGADLTVGSAVYSNQPGSLRADGVVFSSLNATPGAWDGISFSRYSHPDTSLLTNCVVVYGGASSWNSNIHVDRVSPIFVHCLIHHSDGYGLHVTGATASPVIASSYIVSNDIGVYCATDADPIIGGAQGNSNAISGNTTWGVLNIDPDVTVDATWNWWGDVAGPSGEGPGSGDAVSTHVDFDPWRTTPLGDAPANFNLLTPENQAVEGALTVFFDWEDALDPSPGDTTRYRLEISLDDGFTPEYVTTIDSLLASQYPMNSGLSDDTRYWWRVTAFDQQEQETNCNQQDWYLDIFVVEPPDAFDLLSPDHMETVMFTSPLLAWETATDPDPGDVVAYVVYIDETAGFTSADSVETAETGVYTPYCAPGSIWYWRVKAVDSFGAFTLSETRAFYVDLDAGPRPVNDLMIELLDDDDIELTWTAIPGADRYDVYTSTTPYGAFSLYDNTVADFYLDVDGALAGELYYQVIAVDEDLLFNYWRDLDGQRIDRVTK